MKKILLFVAMALVSLQSCEKSVGSGQGPISEKAMQALETRYPGARNVTWERKNSYVVATFTDKGVGIVSSDRLSAWFDNDGSWYMTETDIRFDQLPDAVKTAFAAGVYVAWQVDEVDKIERSETETVYVIEVKQSGKEMGLYYAPDGVLTKEMADMDDDYDYEDYISSLPNASIESYLKANYPNARILEIDREGLYTEVEILDGKVKRELIFDSGSMWLRTKTELRTANLPALIMQVLQASEYAAFRIDDVDHYITTTSEYYRFELKSGKGDVNVKITKEGVLTVVGNGSDDDDHYTGSLNQACTDLIAKQYSGAKIIESEFENGFLEVEIWHDNREKTVRFNASNIWVDTRWDILLGELPQTVKNAIAASNYATYQLDDAEYIQTPTGDYYEVELQKGNHEVTMRIE